MKLIIILCVLFMCGCSQSVSYAQIRIATDKCEKNEGLHSIRGMTGSYNDEVKVFFCNDGAEYFLVRGELKIDY